MYKAWGKLKEIKELVKLVTDHLTTWHKPKLEVSYLKQLFTRIICTRYSSRAQLLAKVFLCLRMKYARWNISLEKMSLLWSAFQHSIRANRCHWNQMSLLTVCKFYLIILWHSYSFIDRGETGTQPSLEARAWRKARITQAQYQKLPRLNFLKISTRLGQYTNFER